MTVRVSKEDMQVFLRNNINPDMVGRTIKRDRDSGLSDEDIQNKINNKLMSLYDNTDKESRLALDTTGEFEKRLYDYEQQQEQSNKFDNTTNDLRRKYAGAIAQGVWGLGDEAAGVGGGVGNVIGGMLTGDFDISKNYQEGYQEQRDKQRKLDQEFQQEHPYINTALQLAGGVGGAGLISKGVGTAAQTIGAIPGVAQAIQPVEQAVQTVSNLIPKTGIAGTLAKSAVGAVKGAASGLGYGALTGIGAAEEMEDIPEMAKEYAKKGAIYGGAIGGAIPVAVDTLSTTVLKPIGKGVNYVKRAFNIGNVRDIEMLGGKENIIRAGFNARNPDGTIDPEKFRQSIVAGLSDESLEKISASASKIGRKSAKSKTAYNNAINKYLKKQEGKLQESLNKIADKQANEVSRVVLESGETVEGITPSKEGLSRLYHSDPTEMEIISQQLDDGIPKEFIKPKNVVEYQKAAGEFINKFKENPEGIQNSFRDATKKLDYDTYKELIRNTHYDTLGPKNIPTGNYSFKARDQLVRDKMANILNGVEKPTAEEIIAIGDHINKIGSAKVLKTDTILKNYKADLNQIKESYSPTYRTLNNSMRGRVNASEGFNKITRDLNKTPASELKKIADSDPNQKIGMGLSLEAEYKNAVTNNNMQKAKDIIDKSTEIMGESFGKSLHRLDPQAQTISKLNDLLSLSGAKLPNSNVAENIAMASYAASHGAHISTANASRNALKSLSRSYSPKQIKNFEKFLSNDNYVEKLRIINKITDPLERRSWGRMLNDFNNAVRNEILLKQANQQGER